MNLGKLARRLKKELAANPKQAAVLGIGCVIAIWFWTPLVMRWLKPKPTVAPVIAEAVAANTTTEPSPTAIPQATKVSWQDVRNWRKADPRTRSPVGVSQRNPFAVHEKMEATEEEVAVAVVTNADEETMPHDEYPAEDATIAPEQLGLTVESIAYSNARRRAQISGRTFKEQDVVPLGNDGARENAAVSQPTCRVKAIEPTYVLVEIRGQEIRLELQQKRLAHGDLVERR